MWSKPTDNARPQYSPSASGTAPPSSPHCRSYSESISSDQQTWVPQSQRASEKANPQDDQTLSSPTASSRDSSLGRLSSSAKDRVFPIRSVVSVDPNPSPISRVGTTSDDGISGTGTPASATTGRRYSSRQISMTSPSLVTSIPDKDINDPPLECRGDTGLRAESTQGDRDPSPASSNHDHSRQSSIRDTGEHMGDTRQMQCVADPGSVPFYAAGSKGYEDDRSTAGSVRSVDDDVGGLITARFKHVVTEDGHAVIVGRDGDTLQRCEDEPIHIPGAVQGFGLLVALQELEDGKFQVRIVSENSKRIIGFTPEQLFGLDNFCDILSDEQTDNLLDHIDFIRSEDVDPSTNGPEVFTLAIKSPSKETHKMWCAMHINESNRNLIICEFELEDDPINPLLPPGESSQDSPEDTLDSNPSLEEYAESTVNISKPLRVLRGARKRKGEAAAMEVFNVMSQVQEQLANASTLDIFLKILVGVVKELTGFHRVMIYQFDSAWNGRVVTELVDPRATKDLYKGLNFPASDIPKQARDMYKINKVRLLYDREQETARLVCRTIEDLENPLDLTFAYLRAMSPIHIKYLSHMAVRASMSISINAFNELWGLIACHSYGSKGMRVSFPIRKMCRLVGDSASRNIERLSYASRLQARKLINTAPTQANPSGYIIASSDDLLKLFDADYGLLSIRNETKIFGKLEHTQEALAMLEYLRLRKIPSVISSTDIRLDFPDLIYSPGFDIIAGLLLVPLSVSGVDFIVFFRKGQVREVKWAGNPYEKFIKEGTEGYLEPRRSFKTWSETVVGKCREWTEEQIETGAVLCLVYGKFIEVWRQKEDALQNSKLTKLLLANSAHEVRTPLNAIINYLEIALEGAIDQETRDNLSRSHSASKSLIYVINDLLDLTKTEEGHNLIRDETFDLPATIREATDPFIGDAKRKGIEYETIRNTGVPQYVVGDQRRIRQAISNVTANAIQHTSRGAVKVEMWLANKTDTHVDIDIVVQDTGCGMSPTKLDEIFKDLEQVQTEDDLGLQEKLSHDAKTSEDKDQSQRTLGLGLALVARIIRTMNGQMRLKSEEGKGSRFVIQLGFDLPAEDEKKAVLADSKAGEAITTSDKPTTPPIETGEIVLVNKSPQKSPLPETKRVIPHHKSAENMPSLDDTKSLKRASFSGGEVGSLIEAFQGTTMASTLVGASTDLNPNLIHDKETRRLDSVSRSRPTSVQISGPSSRTMSPPDRPVEHEGLGMLSVTDSKVPIKPIRMQGGTSTSSPTPGNNSRHLSSQMPSRAIPRKQEEHETRLDAEELRILVAEDDPINSKIIQKRLGKVGHDVHLTINGEECASSYGEKPAFFDVVLMDMQMPIVDGLTSTKMIRSFEKSHTSTILSKRATLNGRTPIFAVSASLLEKERQTYIDAGFDGWILKPIDFKRLGLLLLGIVDDETRKSCLYEAGHWERGGWFDKSQPDVFSSHTTPSPTAVVSSSKSMASYPAQPNESASDTERERLASLDNDAIHAESRPSNPGQSGNVQHSLEGGYDQPS